MGRNGGFIEQFGAVDLATSLALGQPVVQRGLLSEVDGGILVLPMAERLSSATAARIAAALPSSGVLVSQHR